MSVNQSISMMERSEKYLKFQTAVNQKIRGSKNNHNNKGGWCRGQRSTFSRKISGSNDNGAIFDKTTVSVSLRCSCMYLCIFAYICIYLHIFAYICIYMDIFDKITVSFSLRYSCMRRLSVHLCWQPSLSGTYDDNNDVELLIMTWKWQLNFERSYM